MNCARCNKPLKGAYDTIVIDGATGPGGTVTVCPVWCRRAPTQSSPASRRKRIWER